jgi:hypothetical protein
MKTGMWGATPLIVAAQYNQASIFALILDFLAEYSSLSNAAFFTSSSNQRDAEEPFSTLTLLVEPSERREQVRLFLNHRTEKGASALLLACMGDEAMDDVAARLLRDFAGE